MSPLTERVSAQKVMDDLPACICVVKSDGSIKFANKKALRALENSARNLSAERWLDLIHPDQQTDCYKCWLDSVTAKSPLVARWLLFHHDGQYRWHHISAEPSLNAEGEVEDWYMIGIDIHEQVLAEQELRSGEREARELLNRFPALLTVRGPSGIEFVSECFMDHLGKQPSELLGFEWLQVAHPDDRERIGRIFKESIRTGTRSEWIWRVRDKQGHYRWFHTQSEPFREQDSSIQHWYAVTADIDEVLRSKELIRDHRMQLELLAESVPGFLWKALPSGEIIYLNDYCEEYLGMPPDLVRKMGWSELIHPEDRHDVAKRWNILVEGGQWHEQVCRLIGKDGEYRWFQSLITTVKDEAGKVVALHGLMMDAHTMVSAEQSSRQEKKQLRHFVDAIPAMIWRADPNGEIDQWNRTMIEAIGRPQESVESFDLMSKIAPDQAEAADSNWQRSVRMGIPHEDVYRILGNDGEYHWHMVRALPFRDESGAIVSWYGIHTDIDERKRTEDRLRLTQAKLSRASRVATVAELSASIAHELNQPLMSVMANAQAAKRWLSSATPNLEEANASLERVIRDSRGADETMQRIRALFQRGTFEKKDASISEILKEALRLVQEDVTKRNPVITLDVEGQIPPVSVDPIQVQSVLINLITNAIDAMETNTLDPRLTVRVSSDHRDVSVEVIDNGPGIDDPETIFEPFISTKKKGMGIGLAVSRSIVEAHDGQLWAENNSDSGARFTLKLPMGNCSLTMIAQEREDC